MTGFRPKDYQPPDIPHAPPRRHWRIPGWLVALACGVTVAVLTMAGFRVLIESAPGSADQFQDFPEAPGKLVTANSLAIVIPDASPPYCDALHDQGAQKWRLCIWQSGTGSNIHQLTATVRYFPTGAQKSADTSGSAAALAELGRLRTALVDVVTVPKLGDQAFSGFDRTANKAVTAVAISNVTVQATYTERLSLAATANTAPPDWRSAANRVAKEMVAGIR